MSSDRSWMYQRFLPNGAPDPEWQHHVVQWVEVAFSHRTTVYIREGKECISCPCYRCNNVFTLDRETVMLHILQKGFCNGYEIWHQHGEHRQPDTMVQTSLSGHQDCDGNRMEEMLMNATGPDFNWDDKNTEELPNTETRRFFEMLKKSEEPLWEMDITRQSKVKCENHSVLSAVTQCLTLKAEHQMS
jgi:Transposase-associated domain